MGEEGWEESCSASQAGGIALAAALPGFHSASQGEILPLTPGFSPATPEAGQGGSRKVPALPAPNTSSHLQQANHEDELFAPAASSALIENLHPSPQETMEELYISKLHPVVDYGAGVFLLIIGELTACSFAWSQGTGYRDSLSVLWSGKRTWKEMTANISPQIPLLSALELVGSQD